MVVLLTEDDTARRTAARDGWYNIYVAIQVLSHLRVEAQRA